MKSTNNWKWFKVYNVEEIEKQRIPTASRSVILKDYGRKSFVVFYSQIAKLFTVTIDGIALTPNLNNRNAFSFGKRSAYIDTQKNLWLGFENEN